MMAFHPNFLLFFFYPSPSVIRHEGECLLPPSRANPGTATCSRSHLISVTSFRHSHIRPDPQTPAHTQRPTLSRRTGPNDLLPGGCTYTHTRRTRIAEATPARGTRSARPSHYIKTRCYITLIKRNKHSVTRWHAGSRVRDGGSAFFYHTMVGHFLCRA
jgi:hypothetical protein